jgi:hypothetical protein
MKSITTEREAQMPDDTGRSGSKPLDSAGDEQDMFESEVTITCPLCEAQFAPEPEHGYLLHVGPDALDAAFQSVCHVCFRCHRSACPQCWDNVHRFCGACVEEVGLVFRTEATPLEGLLFTPVLQTSSHSTKHSAVPVSTPFVCIRPGRFETALQPAKQTQTYHQSPTQLGSRLQTSARLAASSYVEAHDAVGDAGVDDDDVDDELPVGSFARMLAVIEWFLMFVLFLVLLAVAVATILAVTSLAANAWIERLLHVDIRAEIAYVITLIRQIHL